jgi:hypothetical protein
VSRVGEVVMISSVSEYSTVVQVFSLVKDIVVSDVFSDFRLKARQEKTLNWRKSSEAASH